MTDSQGSAARPASAPIDLGSQIDQELQAVNLVIAALQNQPLTNLRVQAEATRDHLALLKAHMDAAAVTVTVSPNDPDFQVLSAIGARLDASIRNGALVSTGLDDLNLLLSTVNRGFEIASGLTPP